MTDHSGILQDVMKEYLDDDEDFAKEIMFEGSVITFKVDLIDDFLPVKVKILDNNSYKVKYGTVNKQERNPSFKRFLKALLDDLMKERVKKIEFYDSLNTPCEASKDVFGKEGGGDDEEPEFEDDEDEDEGEDDEFTVDVETEGVNEWNDVKQMTSEINNLKILSESLYNVLTPEKLIEMQNVSVKKVSEILNVTQGGAKIILRAYRWNEEKIMNTFTKRGKERVLRDVGLKGERFEKKVEENFNPEDEYECPSCYDDLPYSDTYVIDACGHRFCNDCWKEHLTVKIKDGLSKRILCMGGGCQCAVDESVVSQYITDPKVKKRYETKVMESFVEDNLYMKWCQSAPHCGSAVQVRVSPKIPLAVQCLCAHSFCFSCLEEAHNPCSCQMLEFWKGKSATDLLEHESMKWLKSNTRACPACKTPSQKNGGCNHITCKCGGHWCWACGGEFDTSTVYSHSCNQFLEKGGQQKDTGGTKENLERYMHYYNRYNTHKTSIENQRKMEKKTYRQIRTLHKERPNAAIVEIEWIKKGLSVLFDSRNALMFSYVLAYFVFDRGDCLQEKDRRKILVGCKKFQHRPGTRNPAREKVKLIFEDTQAQLEITTEEMNKILDMSLERILTEESRMKIMRFGILNERRLHGLFDIIREEMVIDEEFKLPIPRYICTKPQTKKVALSSLPRRKVAPVRNIGSFDHRMRNALKKSKRGHLTEQQSIEEAMRRSMVEY